jgi:hypothetical protein
MPLVPAIAPTPPSDSARRHVATRYEIASIRGFPAKAAARDTRTEY